MNSSRSLRLLAALALLAASATLGHADTAESVSRATAIVQRLVELNQKYSAYDVELPAATPINGATGKYILPIDSNGALTEWALKALNAQVGNVAGEQAGSAAGKGLANVVPGGGLASGFLKKKGKEAGALAALGGPDFIKKTSSLSFDTVEAYAVYLHAKLGKNADYSKAVQAAIALYPDLEKTYSASVTAAYDAVVKDITAKKAAADAEKAKAEAEAKAVADAAKVATVTSAAATTP
jgi:hypothetical protein